MSRLLALLFAALLLTAPLLNPPDAALADEGRRGPNGSNHGVVTPKPPAGERVESRPPRDPSPARRDDILPRGAVRPAAKNYRLPDRSGERAAAGASIEGRFIVLLRDDAGDPSAVADDFDRRQGIEVTHVYRVGLKGFAAKLPPAVLRDVRQDPRVAAVEPNRIVTAAVQTEPWGVRRVEAAPAAKNAAARIDGVDGTAGSGERVDADVAVIDSGIDGGHPDLNVVGGADCTGANSPFTDGNSHGTHVAGTVGAIDDQNGVVGVAPGARLWAIKVLGADGAGAWSWIICGVQTVAANADLIEVANMSIGHPPASFGLDDRNCGNSSGTGIPADYQALHRAVCAAVGNGVTIVAAAGNDCADAARVVPAAFDEVITVGAFADTDGRPGGQGPAGSAGNCAGVSVGVPDDAISPHSNFGADVDIWAPGVNVYSTVPGNAYGPKSGTSMATPHVAGAVALYYDANPGGTPAGARAWLLSNREQTAVTNPFGDGRPISHGQGRLNVNDSAPWGTADTVWPQVAIASVSRTGVIGIQASDVGSGVARVEVRYCRYRGTPCNWSTSKKIGGDDTAPYKVTWRKPPVGRWGLVAAAWDRAGNGTLSATVKVSVTRSGRAAGGSAAIRLAGGPSLPPADAAISGGEADGEGGGNNTHPGERSGGAVSPAGENADGAREEGQPTNRADDPEVGEPAGGDRGRSTERPRDRGR